MRKLLTVESTFELAGRGVLVLPELAIGRGRPEQDPRAELRRADGRVFAVDLIIAVEHRSLTLDSPPGTASWARVCMLRGIAHADVVAGSELWCADDVAPDAIST